MGRETMDLEKVQEIMLAKKKEPDLVHTHTVVIMIFGLLLPKSVCSVLLHRGVILE